MENKSKKQLQQLLVRREIGLYKSLNNHCANIYKSLLYSDRRIFLRELEYNSCGNITYDDNHLFMEHEKWIVNISDRNNRSLMQFSLPAMYQHEKMVSMLPYSTGDFCHIAKSHYKFIIILTTFGRLLFFDYIKRRLAYQFNLPTERWKYKKLEWNRENHSLWISGNERQPEEGRQGGRRGKAMVIAVFELDPLKFQGMFEVTSEHFGYKTLSNHSLVNDMLFIWDSQPYRVFGFNFNELYRNTATMSYKPYELANTNQLLPINMSISSKVDPVFTLKGSFQTVGFTGLPYHLFATPASPKADFLLVSTKIPHMQLLSLKDFLKRPKPSQEIGVESIDSLFHVDESGTFFRFEETELISYKLKGQSGEFVVSWRTELWNKVQEHVQSDRLLNKSVRMIAEGKRLNELLVENSYFGDDKEHMEEKRARRMPKFFGNQQPSSSMARRPSMIAYDESGRESQIPVRRASTRLRTRMPRIRENVIHHDRPSSSRTPSHIEDERENGLSYEMLTSIRQRNRSQPLYTSLAIRMDSPYMVVREVMLETWLNTLMISVACDIGALLGNLRAPYALRLQMLAMMLILNNETGEILRIIPLDGTYIEGTAAEITLEDHLLVYGQKERSKAQFNVYRMEEIGIHGDDSEKFEIEERGGNRNMVWRERLVDPYDLDEMYNRQYDDDYDPSDAPIPRRRRQRRRLRRNNAQPDRVQSRNLSILEDVEEIYSQETRQMTRRSARSNSNQIDRSQLTTTRSTSLRDNPEILNQTARAAQMDHDMEQTLSNYTETGESNYELDPVVREGTSSTYSRPTSDDPNVVTESESINSLRIEAAVSTTENQVYRPRRRSSGVQSPDVSL